MSEANVIENKFIRHVSDGITYAGIQRYKCKNCGKKLTSEEFKDNECIPK